MADRVERSLSRVRKELERHHQIPTRAMFHIPNECKIGVIQKVILHEPKLLCDEYYVVPYTKVRDAT